MKHKKKPDFDVNEISKEYMDRAVSVYQKHESIRAAARELEISPMKLRKILITDGCYDNEMSREVFAMHKSGMSVEEIAESEGMTVSNVYAYLPYDKIIYKLEQKSVTADKQQRYRDRKETCTVGEDLITWLEHHPGIVADIRRRAGLDKNDSI